MNKKIKTHCFRKMSFFSTPRPFESVGKMVGRGPTFKQKVVVTNASPINVNLFENNSNTVIGENPSILNSKGFSVSGSGALLSKKYDTAYSKLSEVKLITIGLASPEKIRQWAEKTLPNKTVLGQVTNANTLAIFDLIELLDTGVGIVMPQAH